MNLHLGIVATVVATSVTALAVIGVSVMMWQLEKPKVKRVLKHLTGQD